jgi:hypothetical protein
MLKGTFQKIPYWCWQNELQQHEQQHEYYNVIQMFRAWKELVSAFCVIRF